MPVLLAALWLLVGGGSLAAVAQVMGRGSAGALALVGGRHNHTVSPAGVDGVSVLVTSQPAVLVADGESTATLKAAVRDAAGQPVADGTLVGWATTLGRLAEPGALAEAEAEARVITGTWQQRTDDEYGVPGGGAYLWSETAGSSLAWSFTAPAVVIRYGQQPENPATFTVQVDAWPAISLTTAAPVKSWRHATVAADLSTGRHAVTFTLASGSLAIDQLTAGTATVGGVASNVLHAGTAVGVAQVTATAYFTQSVERGSTAVSFIAGPPAAVQLESPTLILPIGGLSTAIRASVVDAWKRPVPDGTVVEWSTTLGTLEPERSVTVDGQATAVLTSGTELGIAVVRATAGGVSGRLEISFVAGPPAGLALEVAPASIPANSVAAADLAAFVTDAWGNPVADDTAVQFKASLGTVSPEEAPTRAGMARSRLTAGAVAGLSRLVARAGAASGTAEITLTALDAWVRKDVEPQTAVVPGETVSYTVSFGNSGRGTIYGLLIEEPLPDGLVWPRIAADGPALNALPDRPPLAWEVPRLRAGESGVITVALRVDPGRRWGNRTVITNSVRVGSPTAAELNPLDNGSAASIVVVPGAAYTVTVAAPDRLSVGGQSGRVVATVTDRFGNPARDGTVLRFTTDLGSVSPTEGLTARGVATTTFTSGTRAGLARVRALTEDGRGGSDVIRLLPLSAVELNLDAGPGQLVVGGATMPITVTALDPYDNAVSGVNVALAVDRGSVEPGFGRTGARGFVTNTLCSPQQAGPATVLALAGDLRVEAAVLFVPAAVHEVQLEPRWRRIALGRSVAIQALVVDRFANPIPAVRVLFSTSNGAMMPTTAFTAADGQAVSVLRPSRTGAAVVTAIASGVLGSTRVDVTPAVLHLPFVTRPR